MHSGVGGRFGVGPSQLLERNDSGYRQIWLRCRLLRYNYNNISGARITQVPLDEFRWRTFDAASHQMKRSSKITPVGGTVNSDIETDQLMAAKKAIVDMTPIWADAHRKNNWLYEVVHDVSQSRNLSAFSDHFRSLAGFLSKSESRGLLLPFPTCCWTFRS